MTVTTGVLLGAAGIAAVVDWAAVALRSKRVEYVAKPGTLALLVGVALAIEPHHADRRAWFVAALVLSLAGDVLLMVPRDLFVAGLAAFLLGHVAYTVGIDLHAGSWVALVVAAVVVASAGVVLASRILVAMTRGGRRELVGPVVAYMVVISAMVTSALAAGPWLAGAGAASFFASDALIAWERFVRPRPWMPVAIIVTYHLGQAGLVVSLTR